MKEVELKSIILIIQKRNWKKRKKDIKKIEKKPRKS